MSDRRGVTILGRSLELSNLEKVLYPQTGLTKAGVLNYYRSVAPWLLGHLRCRPLTLKRYPDGAQGEPFYEKRCPQHRPDWMSVARLAHEEGKEIGYCQVNDLASLMWTGQIASLELHVLLSRHMAPRRPTAVVFDLDPGPGVSLTEAGRIALRLRRVLEGIGLESRAKVSGGKGVHCYVPLNTPISFDKTKHFARTVARRMEAHYEQEVTSRMPKKHREGKVFIDWSQNDRHKTTVCAYSLRAGPRPTVSAPVTWDELSQAVEAGDSDALRFGPQQVIERLDSMGDLLGDVLTLRQHLPGVEPETVETPARWQSDADSDDQAREALEAYRKRRQLDKTPEPASGGDLEQLRGTFVIQKHAASSLHYDFRLECDGVLKSWAVPKGPSTDPADKRLAVRVEDHPLAYAVFEGVIPADQYGGGQVIVWDRGAYALIDVRDGSAGVRAGLDKGHLRLQLEGVKLQGRWDLIRTGDKQGQDKEQWLLSKADDEAASPQAQTTRRECWSVLSGLWNADLAGA